MKTRFFVLFFVFCLVATLVAPGAVAATPTTDLPDLTVELSFFPTTPQPGDPVAITVTIRNQGTLLARDVCSRLYGASQVPYENCLHTSLYPGYSYSWTKTGLIFSAGTHELCAWVDPDNTIPESNEFNNQVCQDLTVGASQRFVFLPVISR